MRSRLITIATFVLLPALAWAQPAEPPKQPQPTATAASAAPTAAPTAEPGPAPSAAASAAPSAAASAEPAAEPSAQPSAEPSAEPPATPPAVTASAGKPAAPAASGSAAAADDGVDPAAKELFIQKCASCHSIGEGPRMGPDLKGVHERRDAGWLKRMIQTPTAMLASDPVARQLLADFKNTKMPDLGLSDEQVQTLIGVISACSAVKCDLAGKLVPVSKATADDIARGRGLFMGTVAQKNGGPACISCHTMEGAGGITGGGTMSKDLTNAFARLGDSGLDAALRSPAFPLMNKVFGDRPLIAEEVFALRAALNAANQGKLAKQHAAKPISVILIALLLAALVLILLNATWSKRQRPIRSVLVARKEPQS